MAAVRSCIVSCLSFFILRHSRSQRELSKFRLRELDETTTFGADVASNKSRAVILTRSTGHESVTQQSNKRFDLLLSPRLHVESLSLLHIGLLGDASTARKLLIQILSLRLTSRRQYRRHLMSYNMKVFANCFGFNSFSFCSFVCFLWHLILRVVNENQQTFHTALSVLF